MPCTGHFGGSVKGLDLWWRAVRKGRRESREARRLIEKYIRLRKRCDWSQLSREQQRRKDKLTTSHLNKRV